MTDFDWGQEAEEAKRGEIVPPLANDDQRNAAWLNDDTKPRSDRLSIEHIADLYRLEGLVDGGYITFIYGSRKGNFGGWDIQKFKYGNHLILLDSGGVRQKEYEPYKSRRSDRRQQYDYMRETYERVQFFRKVIAEDPAVHTASIEGYEADDVIALLFIMGIGTKSVIAQDKDFFMLEGMREVMIDHTGVPQNTRDLKLPKYAIKPNNSASWALSQAIFGDKSDSIPRLLPSRSGYKQMYHRLINQAPNVLSAFWNCYAEFGEQFLINLRLVLLPHPSLSVYAEDYKELPNMFFDDLVTKEYWTPENFSPDVLDIILQSIHQSREFNW